MPRLPIPSRPAKSDCQIALGYTTLVVHMNGWGQLAELQRAAEDDGVILGLDAANLVEAFGAGNAVVTRVVESVTNKLKSTEK